MQCLRPTALPRALSNSDVRPVVVLRLPSGTPPDELDLLRGLAGRVGRWIDPPHLVGRAHHKPGALDILATAGIPVPPSVCLLRDEPGDLAGLPGDLFVLKPVRGAAGHGVTMALDRERALLHGRAHADLGIAHFCFQVTDLDEEYERLVAAGMEFVSGPVEQTPEVANCYGRDPDGNLIELIEYK